ncbi:MAG: hypothetical protein ACRD12_17330, partial [Acidimicrobiales bacterium]
MGAPDVDPSALEGKDAVLRQRFEQLEHEQGVALRAMEPNPRALALHSDDRYALQIDVQAATPADALDWVLSRWNLAVSQVRLPAWEVVRTEVLTPEEFERDLLQMPLATPAILAPPASSKRPGPDDAGDLLRRVFSDPLTGTLSGEVFGLRLGHALLT